MYWRQVVSQSPTTADADQETIAHYLSVWEPLNQRILTGSSFSGNERNCCFLNTGKRQFADVSASSALNYLDDSRTIAVTDWDHDGDLDIWLTNRTSPRIRFLRNDTPTNNKFVAFQLEGLPAANCPRDAYGARVEVTFNDDSGKTESRSQTLHGGDSYLSQSTKWLHFGMKPNESIASVSVRWPGSKEAENFSGVTIGKHWMLAQSAGVAKMSPSKVHGDQLSPSELASVPVKATGRLKISWPQTVGELPYRDMSDRLITRKAESTRPALFVCWASWCEPCLAELKELSGADLGDIEVIALNIEQATSGDAPSNNELTGILDRVGFHGTRGIATINLLGTLNQKHLDAIYVRANLPLPVSFLVDQDGLLRVVYKGRLDVSQVAKDRQQLDAKGRNSMALSIPFPGRWSEEFLDGNPIAVARVYVQDGAQDDAETFLKYYLKVSQPSDESIQPLNESAQRLRAAVFHELAKIAFRSGRSEEGFSYCQQALKLNPNSVPVLLAVISHLATQGEFDAAKPYCIAAQRIAGGHPSVEYQLGSIAMGKKDFAAATKHFQIAITANPKMSVAANNLAWILATNPNEKLRDGPAAVAAAKLACDATEYRDYRLFSTLAAAYAENQQFDDAIEITKKSIQMAAEKNDSAMISKSKERLKLYESKTPLRD